MRSMIISDWINNSLVRAFLLRKLVYLFEVKSSSRVQNQQLLSCREDAFKLTDRFEANNKAISYGTMHLAKGLEFKSVAVVACDEDVLLKQDRLQRVTDASDLAEVYDPLKDIYCMSPALGQESIFS